MTEAQPAKKSDLGVRVLSAIVMVAVAGTALWLGGWGWTAFVIAVAMGVFREWRGLVRAFTASPISRGIWYMLGVAYIVPATVALRTLRIDDDRGWIPLALLLIGVIGTDIGAYFVGRTVGGPKVAPKISPSKTWSGLLGGATGAALGVWIVIWITVRLDFSPGIEIYFDGDTGEPIVLKGTMDGTMIVAALLAGSAIAVVAQAGDFFESWLKRRAGVKDSGNLIPGHGGLFDRVDGLLAVCFVIGVLMLTDPA